MQEDRIDWMEAIKPGSAQFLKQMQHSRSFFPSPTPNVYATSQHSVSQKPQPFPRKHPSPDVQSKAVPMQTTSTVPEMSSLPLNCLRSSLEASSSPPKLPQNYVEPTAFPDPDPTASLPFNLLKRNGHPPPIVRRPNHTYSHKPHNHTKLPSRSSSDTSFPENLSHYEIMDPEEVPQPVAVPRSGRPKPKPRTRSTHKSVSTSQTVEPPSSLTDDILGDDEDGDYLCLIDDKKPSGPLFVSKAPVPAERKGSGPPPNVAEQLIKTFDREQLGSLIQMLQQVQGLNDGGDDAWSPDSPDQGPETSLRGNFSKWVGKRYLNY